jgi:hypothetical protein
LSAKLLSWKTWPTSTVNGFVVKKKPTRKEPLSFDIVLSLPVSLKFSTIESIHFNMNTPSKRKEMNPESPKNGKKSREEGKEVVDEHNHSKEMLPIELVVPVQEPEQQHTEDLELIPGLLFVKLTIRRAQNLLWRRR